VRGDKSPLSSAVLVFAATGIAAAPPVNTVRAMVTDILCSVRLQLLAVLLLTTAITAKIPWWNIKIAQEQG
jgi:hypothetical protein